MDSNETGGMNWTDDMEQKFNPLCDAGNLW